MGLFGLTTTEAIILAQKYNKADNERNEQRIRAINKQTEEIKKHNQELLKKEQEKVSEMNREARQLEPFITLNIFNVWPDQSISIRPSDIKIMNAKVKISDDYDYDRPAPWGGYYKDCKHYPYTEIQLWDDRKFNVEETIDNIQTKVNEVIEKMVDLQVRTLNRIINHENLE